MTLKNAAFLALIGMTLLMVLVAADFVITLSGVLRDVVPAVKLLASLVYLLASLSMVAFLYVFYDKQA
jgi:hypothetical protein